jgi:hypothetical protein
LKIEKVWLMLKSNFWFVMPCAQGCQPGSFVSLVVATRQGAGKGVRPKLGLPRLGARISSSGKIDREVSSKMIIFIQQSNACRDSAAFDHKGITTKSSL